MDYLDRLADVATLDVEYLKMKEAEYKGSWKQRGGVGAYMMLCRKWDRLKNQVEADPLTAKEQEDLEDILESIRTSYDLPADITSEAGAALLRKAINSRQFDIFTAIERDPRPEGILDDIRDLRRYLLLVEAYMLTQMEE